MRVFTEKVGKRSATLTCYVQETASELPALETCPAVLIFPGGAYFYCSDREAEPVALAYMQAGYNAFILRYTTSENCPSAQVFQHALPEAEEALEYLRTNAAQLHIDAQKIAVVGFSAGGHLAAALGTMGRVRPDALVLGYAGFTISMDNLGVDCPAVLDRVDEKTPPSFLFATQGDRLVPTESSLEYAQKLAGRKIPYELHVFAYGDHGASLGTENVANTSSPANPDVTPRLNMSLTFLKRIFNKDSLIPEKPDVTEYGLDMRIKRLVTDEKSLPIIMELLPELLDAYQADNSAGDLSPRRLQKYSKGMFDSEKLAALEAA